MRPFPLKKKEEKKIRPLKSIFLSSSFVFILAYSLISQCPFPPLAKLFCSIFPSQINLLIVCDISCIQFSHSILSLCDPMDCSMPSFPVCHQLPELIQTHVHQIIHAIQPCHPVSPPSPRAFKLSQHQGLFQ